MSVMTHRGYAARVEFDADDRIFIGHVAGVRDVVGFHGASVDELEAAFREAVDDYLQACEKLGQAPAKPFSGRVMFRIDPQVHARPALAAQLAGLSLNEWGERAMSHAAEQATAKSWSEALRMIGLRRANSRGVQMVILDVERLVFDFRSDGLMQSHSQWFNQ